MYSAGATYLLTYINTLDVIFLCFRQALTLNKRFYGLCLWASDPLIDRF